MRRVWIILLVLPLISWGCKNKTPGSQATGQPYVVQQVQGPFSPEDTRAAFQALGLAAERFECFLPQAGQLHLFVRRYVDGQLAATPGQSALSVDSGNQRFLLFTHTQDSSLTLTSTCGGAMTSWGRIGIGGCRASTSQAMAPVTLTPGQEVPLYVYAASNGDLASTAGAPVEQWIAQYPLTIVVYARWQPNAGS
jgi:hypothetical protein